MSVSLIIFETTPWRSRRRVPLRGQRKCKAVLLRWRCFASTFGRCQNIRDLLFLHIWLQILEVYGRLERCNRFSVQILLTTIGLLSIILSYSLVDYVGSSLQLNDLQVFLVCFLLIDIEIELLWFFRRGLSSIHF